MNIRDLMTAPELLGEHFSGDTFSKWRTLLSGFHGLPLNDDELNDWQTLTQREEAPQAALSELWMVVGRRGGKTQAAAILAVEAAFFHDYTDRLSAGEVATVMILAADKKQARSAFRYISGLIESNPMMRRMVVRETTESIELSNRVNIEVHAASFRNVRGYSIPLVVADEIAFWRNNEDSANPDAEILNALRPAMASMNGKLVALSSPYAKRGELWETYRRYYGKDDTEVLVAQADTLTMNPTIPQKFIDAAIKRDPASARSEYGAQFRDDIAAFISPEDLEAVTRTDYLRLPYQREYTYTAFIDPNGGGKDEFTLAISHNEGGRIVVDLVEGRKGVPAEITAGYAQIIKEYKCGNAFADRFAGSWPSDEFKKHGVKVSPAGEARTGLYLAALPAILSGQVELPPDETMLKQFQNLERRTARSGRETIDHSAGQHDDRANAVAGVIAHARTKTEIPKLTIRMY